jgi:hypothetical protein
VATTDSEQEGESTVTVAEQAYSELEDDFSGYNSANYDSGDDESEFDFAVAAIAEDVADSWESL